MDVLNLPCELIIEIFKLLSLNDLSNASKTNKHIYTISSKMLYNNVIIDEYYSDLRFRKTFEFMRTISNSRLVAKEIKRLKIKWIYPDKIEKGFDSIESDFRKALVNMVNLEALDINIRLKDKSFNKIFSSRFMFNLTFFRCNFGMIMDQKKFIDRNGKG